MWHNTAPIFQPSFTQKIQYVITIPVHQTILCIPVQCLLTIIFQDSCLCHQNWWEKGTMKIKTSCHVVLLTARVKLGQITCPPFKAKIHKYSQCHFQITEQNLPTHTHLLLDRLVFQRYILICSDLSKIHGFQARESDASSILQTDKCGSTKWPSFQFWVKKTQK